MVTRLRRAEMVERNREAVLDAARRVFIERGYTGATLETIAEEAGFSKGVVYSQFASKPDLFLALLERRIAERAEENQRIVATHSGADALRRMLETAIERAGTDAAWALLLIEFRALASRDPLTNRRYARLHARTVDGLVSALEPLYQRARASVSFPPQMVAQFILALDSGIALERGADPEALPAGAVAEMVGHVVGITAAGRRRPFSPAPRRERRTATRQDGAT